MPYVSLVCHFTIYKVSSFWRSERVLSKGTNSLGAWLSNRSCVVTKPHMFLSFHNTNNVHRIKASHKYVI